MTSLVNEKKIVGDSILIVHGYEGQYQDKAKEASDTTASHKLIDTSTSYYAIGLRLKERLQEIDFSIDSLSKMK